MSGFQKTCREIVELHLRREAAHDAAREAFGVAGVLAELRSGNALWLHCRPDFNWIPTHYEA